MSVNPILNKKFGNASSASQEMYSKMIIEAIKIKGFDILYIPRTIVNLDPLFLEDPLSKFDKAYALEAYLENVTGFASSDILSKFGLQLNDSGTFVISKKRWADVVGSNPGLQLPNRPAEGDIIYFHPTHSYFEIKKVNGLDPFYQLGKLYTYKLEVELYTYSSERFNTGIKEVDSIGRNQVSADVLNYETLLQTGGRILMQNGSSILQEGFSLRVADLQANNDFFQEQSKPIIDWSSQNPLG
jgi:hypothetical protein